MKQLFTLITLTSLLLAACGGAPTPDIETTAQATVAATEAAQPTEMPAPKPTHTPMPEPPTDTPAPPQPPPSPADTPVPTPTLALTPTPVPTVPVLLPETGDTDRPARSNLVLPVVAAVLLAVAYFLRRRLAWRD